MPLVRLTLEQLLEAIQQLSSDELSRLDEELSHLRRERLHALSLAVRQRTEEALPDELDAAVEGALRAVRS